MLTRTTDIKKIQQAQLFIMDKIHDICLTHDLKYYLIGGSAIGAVRHKGFIPWDVDIDIAMHRIDYERFIQIATEKIDNNLTILTHQTNKYLLSPHALVVLKDSKLIFNNDLINPQARHEGIYVDVLPLDKVPVNQTVRERQRKYLLLLRKIMEFRMMMNYSSDSKLKRILKKILIPVLYRLPMSPITTKQHSVANWGNKQSDYTEICSMLSHYKYDKLCMPKQWFERPVLTDFEGRQYFVPTEVNLYLHKLFGDYMKLPPEEEQTKYFHLINSAEFIIPQI